MYLAFGIIFLIIDILMASAIIITTVLAIKRGGDTISKKNMFYLAPTLLTVYFLHVVAAAYAGKKFDFFYLFSLGNSALEIFKFKVNDVIFPICKDYPIFYADFVMAFLISAVTVVLSFLSFFSRRIGNFFAVKILLGKKCDIVVGDSDDAVKYVSRTENAVLLGIDLTGARFSELLKKGVPVLKAQLDADRLNKKLKKGGFNVIVFRDAKFSYTKIIDTFAAAKIVGLKLHLEANLQEMKILKEKFIKRGDENAALFLTGFNKYELMARRFVVDYPITKYIPRSFYNPNCTLKGDKQINVVFIGFGKVNYQLFRMCSMQFQFARQEEGRLYSKPVNYYVYDNCPSALHNEFFSRILFEFDEEFKGCDFPKPEKICALDIRNTDINSVDAKKQFKSLVTENSFTYFIISLESDLEDASYAQTVRRLFGGNENYKIFVRAKNDIGEKLNELNDRIIYFGEEKKLYTHENIINDDLTKLAQKINLLYNNISDPPEWLKDLKKDKTLTAEAQRKILDEKLKEPVNVEFMRKSWAALPYIEQSSNLYHALNLPFKLNMLGLDMVNKKSEDKRENVSEEKFYEIYENSGSAEDYGDYAFFFKTETSNVLAFIEHSRWNALYILYDYKQMKKADLKLDNKVDDDGKVKIEVPHKNTAEKRHACLTTYYGLAELVACKYKILYPDEKLDEAGYKDNPKLKELSKIYAYDYMSLDRLYGEVTAMDYRIVKNA